MPIEKCSSFKTSDGRTFLNREEAQLHELEIVFSDASPEVATATAKWVMSQKDAVLAILSTRKPRVAKAKTSKKKVEVLA